MLPKITTSTMLAYLQSIFEEPWKSVSRLAVTAWLVFYVGFLAYAFSQRQTYGFVFCLFFFFENWLYTATYMADARAQELPLVTTGDPDFVEHDFHTIFSSLGVLN